MGELVNGRTGEGGWRAHSPILPCSHAPLRPCPRAPVLPCAHALMRTCRFLACPRIRPPGMTGVRWGKWRTGEPGNEAAGEHDGDVGPIRGGGFPFERVPQKKERPGFSGPPCDWTPKSPSAARFPATSCAILSLITSFLSGDPVGVRALRTLPAATRRGTSPRHAGANTPAESGRAALYPPS